MPAGPDRDEPRERDEASPPGHATLEEVLDRYMEELAEGQAPDQSAYVAANPELADALRGVFRTLDFVEATSKTLNASKLEQNQRLGEFRIIREVGRGGMGVVYEAIQTSLDRRVALKVLPAGVVLGGNSAERFAREAATAGRLHHTNIVPVYGVGVEDGIHYYAMQFIEGRSLADHVKSVREAGTPLGREYFLSVGRFGQQVAEALAHAHEQGTIHRDIKPSNLLLDAAGNVWVTDFGLARSTSLATLTATGDVVGTTRYMSPEQARGGTSALDGRTDIYSLGATLYELLALEPAFAGDTRESVLNQIAFADPRPLRSVDRSIPRDLETIVSRCLEKERDRRYPTARELADDCRRFVAGEPIRARRTSVLVKAARLVKRHPARSTAVLAVLVLVVTTLLLIGQIGRIRAQGRLDRARGLLDDAFAAGVLEQDFGRASSLLDEAQAAGLDTAELHLYRGLVPLLTNRPQAAFSHLNAARERDPDNIDVIHALALAYASTGDTYNRDRLYRRVDSAAIDSALAWYLRGLALSKTTGGAAINAYDHAVRLRSDFTPAIKARAEYRGIRLLTEHARDQLDPMLDDFDALVVFRPDAALSYVGRARGWLYAAAYAGTEPELAELAGPWLGNCRKDLDRALERRREDDAEPLVLEGIYLRFVGEFAAAAAVFRRAIEIDRAAAMSPHPYRVHEVAIDLHATGAVAEALAATAATFESAPAFCPLTLHRALLLAEEGRLTEAQDVCRTSLELQRANPNGTCMSAAVMEVLGRPEEARAAVAACESDRQAGATDLADALAFLAGRCDEEWLLAAAGADPTLVCEYSFLTALKRLARGDRAGARADLTRCVDTAILVFAEYRLAQVMLARLAADPQYPRWVVRAGAGE